MIALVRDYLRRSWIIGILSCIAVSGFHIIACRVFLQIQQQGGGSPLTRLVPQWIQTAFSIGPSTMSDINGFLSVCFQHPFVLTVLLALPITMITGFLTGDIEKRSMALVLARPVGRIQVIGAIALVILFWIILSLLCVYYGIITGSHWTEQSAALNLDAIRQATLNLSALIIAFAGLTAAISSFLAVRSDAVGWALTLVLVMYVWNFLAQIWGATMPNYSLFHFYKPTDVLLKLHNSGITATPLWLVGLIGWIAAVVTFRFRNLSI